MDIAPASTTQTTGPAASASAKSAKTADVDTTSAGTMVTSDFETFLTMLTTQMENQDPLNPIESTDFAVQLATFSGVEQQVRTNDLLAAMQAQLGSGGMSEYASWVGMEVRAVATAEFDHNPITLHPDPASGAERTMVVVRDAATGADVDWFEIPVSDKRMEWPVSEEDGNPFPAGSYTFHLQSIADDVMFSEEQIAVFSEVQELRVVNGETRLVLAGGGDIAAADVEAVRRPDVTEE